MSKNDNSTQNYLKKVHGKPAEGAWAAAIGPALSGSGFESVEYYAENAGKSHWHLITLGMRSDQKLELSVCVGKTESEAGPSQWPTRVFGDIGAYLAQGNIFNEREFIEIQIQTENESYPGALLIKDPELGSPKIGGEETLFLQLVPISSKQIEQLKKATDEEEYNGYVAKVLAELKRSMGDRFVVR